MTTKTVIQTSSVVLCGWLLGLVWCGAVHAQQVSKVAPTEGGSQMTERTEADSFANLEGSGRCSAQFFTVPEVQPGRTESACTRSRRSMASAHQEVNCWNAAAISKEDSCSAARAARTEVTAAPGATPVHVG